MMKFTETTHVHRVWFVSIEGADLLAHLFKDDEGKPWRLVYRFRHYEDDKVWGSKDEKTFYEIGGADDSDAVRDGLESSMDKVAAIGATAFSGQDSKLVIEGGLDIYQEVMAKQPWCSMKKVEAPEGSDTESQGGG